MSRLKTFAGLAVVAYLVALSCIVVPYLADFIGPWTLEEADKECREGDYKIRDWKLLSAKNEEWMALLYYPEDESTLNCDLYKNGPKDYLGYAFCYGAGHSSTIFEEIACFSISALDTEAYLSMNHQNVCLLTVDDGTQLTKTEIDPEQPFVFLLPKNAEVVFTNAAGEKIQPIRRNLQ